MQQKGMELFNSVWRIKWWRYRYVLVAVFILNILLINHFFFDTSFEDLNPFPKHAETESKEQHIVTPSPKPKTNTVAPAHTPSPTHTPAAAVPSQPSSDLSQVFNLNDYEFNAPYIGWPLERVCKEAKVTTGLVYICDNNSGGVGNIRNFILTCIRYAIEAGASGIIMPRIQRRSDKDLGNLFSQDFKPFSYFFDEAHFREVMGKHCSQLHIYDKVEDIPNSSKRNQAHEFYPKDLTPGGAGDGCDERGENRHIDQFRLLHDDWLNRFHRYPNASVPLTVRFRWATFFEWNIYKDGPEFAHTFGDILRFRKDVEELAAITIHELQNFGKSDALPPGASVPGTSKAENATKPIETSAQLQGRGLIDTPYLGVHLRTEGDALGFWPNFDTQTTGYLKEAKERKLKLAYIASGDAKEGHKFGGMAYEQLQMRVVGKTDLLFGENKAKLDKLTWDQQALVDFLVLMKSTHFTGCSFSSFTMNIAFKRHTLTDGIRSRPWKSPGDAFSTLIGRFEHWFGDWMFMYECMWP